ncbi:MAG: DUF3083 family protein [Colwellia sp.]|nr:DUF3083 family protein [Colwellia sp.]
MAISRARSTQHKVHIPNSARGNQYLMAKIPLSDELLAKYSNLIDEKSSKPYEVFYQTLAALFFKINDDLEIESSHFLANDKFPRVRFSPEKMVSQTEQQLLFLYNPEFHTSQNSFYDGAKRPKKLALLFLANGTELRQNSAKFHQKTTEAIANFVEQIGLNKSEVRICDHQHLTYDLYAKNKGIEGTQVHKVRSMSSRYLADEQKIPESTNALTFAVVDFTVNRRIRSLVPQSITDGYNELYNLIANAFITAAKNHNLNNGAVIANGLVPIVRYAEDENVIASGELLMLGYNPKHTSGGYTCKWSSDKLVDTIQLIFVASNKDKTSHGYGKFVNQVELALHDFSQSLDFIKDKEEMLVRLHQHIGFYPDPL